MGHHTPPLKAPGIYTENRTERSQGPEVTEDTKEQHFSDTGKMHICAHTYCDSMLKSCTSSNQTQSQHRRREVAMKFHLSPGSYSQFFFNLVTLSVSITLPAGQTPVLSGVSQHQFDSMVCLLSLFVLREK